MDLVVCHLRGVSIIRLPVLCDRERSDLRLQHPDGAQLVGHLCSLDLRMDRGLFAVPRTVRSDKVGRFGALAYGNDGLAARVHCTLSGWLEAHDTTQYGVNYAS